MTSCYVGLGANLDDPARQVRRALEELGDIDTVGPVSASSFYRSPPLGPQDQPDFINAVAGFDCRLSATELLAALQDIEQAHGRVRERHWGPRTLDLDLLLYGEAVIDYPTLKVPHPEMARRDFVLYPLYEIAPQLTIPGMGKLETLIEQLGPGQLERLDGP